MKKKRALTLSIAGLLFAIVGAFLVNSTSWFWLYAVLLALGMVGMLFGTMWLWQSGLSFFATIAVLTVLFGTIAVHGPPLWFMAFGETRTDCQVLDATKVERTKSASYTEYVVQCGDRRIEYKPYQTTSEYIGDVGERTSLAFDRTGLMKPLRPSDITNASTWQPPAAVVFALLYIWFAATRSSTRSTRERPKVVDQRSR